MRTLKKTLALVLVVAMALSFGVIGATAAFTDVAADNEYKEAIDVLSGIGVINGMTATTFEPDGNLTRAQAAKIVAYIKLGPTYAQLVSSASTQRFDDVATSYWAAGYIEYCANLGIIAGVGDNKFDPEGKLTTAAFTKMLLVAVGFDAEENNFVGASWAINVASKAVDAGIYDKAITISGVTVCTRAQAAQLSLKGLFYSAKGSTTKYIVTDTKGTPEKSDDTVVGSFDEFVEAYLLKTTNANFVISSELVAKDSLADSVFSLTKGDGFDKLGRPSTTYTNTKGTVDLSFAQDATLTYTSKVSATAMGTALKGYTYAGLAEDRNSASDIAALTGNGYTVEIFADSNKKITAVVQIKPEFVTVSVTNFTATKTRGAYTQYSATVNSELKTGKVFSTVVNADNDKNTAVVTGTIANGDWALAYTSTEGNTLYIEAVDTITGVLSAKGSAGVLTIGGSAYELAAAGSDLNAYTIKTVDQSFYVDSFGYVLAPKSNLSSASYAFIMDAYKYSTLDGNKVVTKDYALLAMPDGSVEEVVVVKDSVTDAMKGTAVTFSVGTKGVYTLTAIDDTLIDGTAGTTRMQDTATAIVNKASKMTSDDVSLINNATVFVFVNFKDGEPDGTVNIYTGKNNVPSTTSVDAGKIVAIDTTKSADAIADVVYVYASTGVAASDKYVYVIGTYTQTSDGYVFDVIKGGELTTITVSDNTALTGQTIYKSITDNGSVTTATEPAAGEKYTSVQYKGGLLYTSDTLNATYNTVGADVPVYVIDKYDDSVAQLTASALTAVVAGDVYVSGTGSTVSAIYVVVDSGD